MVECLVFHVYFYCHARDSTLPPIASDAIGVRILEKSALGTKCRNPLGGNDLCGNLKNGSQFARFSPAVANRPPATGLQVYGLRIALRFLTDLLTDRTSKRTNVYRGPYGLTDKTPGRHPPIAIELRDPSR